ncbi:hypothetical protein FHX49_001330 [Microbacterium endophyticum]|uniref:Uncharacterized protein n=1 Tax=Microbacterium endophyticum TaxID=1526412 RepID=A0A7W4V2P8_9MICO|nr:hypothetical protein [Microbacterium endophyticum]MBB2975763.1 hypothetical protein [Microbacterium endophyticum]NIK36246.1 hypothetical protein [Microbacterium endophyticum]
MVTLMLDSAHLEVVLSITEKGLAFRKRNVMIDRSQIVRVQLTDDAWTWLRGVPDPGTYLPVAIAAGSWKSAGGRDFVSIRRRKPSVVIDLEGSDDFQRLILTTSHGVALVQALRLETGSEPIDVVDLATEDKKRKRSS